MTTRRDNLNALHALAYRQAGYFTASQAVDVGFTYQAQKHHLDSGSWQRVERGIFRLRGWPATVNDAFVLWSLWSRGRGVVSHASALAVHELSVLDPGLITLTVAPGFRARTPAVRIVTSTLPADDVEQREGFWVTTPLRTVLDVAQTETQDSVNDAVHDALSRGLITPRGLLSRSDDHGDRAALRIERALARWNG